MCFPECDTFLFGSKTSQHLGHTEGICSHGLLGFISQPFLSDYLGGLFVTSFSENVIRVPRSTHHSPRHNRFSPFSLCLFSFCTHSLQKAMVPSPCVVTHLRNTCILADLNTLKFGQQPTLIQNIAIQNIAFLSFLKIWNCCFEALSSKLFFTKQPC